MKRCRVGSSGGTLRRTVLGAFGIVVTGATLGAAVDEGPSLGAARSFAVLAGTSVTNTGTTVIQGDVGVSPGTSVTGLVAGDVVGGSIHIADQQADDAQAAAVAAFAALGALASDADLSGQDLGGMTLAPGVYTFSSSAGLTGDLILDAGCDLHAVFVFQIGTTLTTAANSTVTVVNAWPGFDASRIYWQVGTSATLGADTAFLGSIVAQTSIGLGNGSTVLGNLLAIDGAVTLDANVVESPPVVEDTSTMELLVDWGHVTDAILAGADQFKFTGTYSFHASPDGLLDPAADGLTISVRVFEEAVPRQIVIAGGDPKWKVTNLGTKFTWTGIGVDGEPWGLTIDDAAHTFIVWSQKFDLSPGDGSGGNWGAENAGEIVPVEIDFTTGDDSAHAHACFRNSLTFNAGKQWGVLRIP